MARAEGARKEYSNTRLEKKQRPDQGLMDSVKNDDKQGGNSDNLHFEMMVWLLCRNGL